MPIDRNAHKTPEVIVKVRKTYRSPQNRPRKPRGRVVVYSSTLSITSALDGGWWSTSRSGRFTPRERPGTRFIGDWVGPRAGLNGFSRVVFGWSLRYQPAVCARIFLYLRSQVMNVTLTSKILFYSATIRTCNCYLFIAVYFPSLCLYAI